MNIKDINRPVIPLLISLIAGIYSGSKFPDFEIWSYVLIFLCIVFILFNIFREKKSFLYPVLLFFFIGYCSIVFYISPKFPSNHIIHYTDGEKFKITGIVSKKPQKYKNRIRFILNSESLEKNGNFFKVTGKIYVTMIAESTDLSQNDRISFKSRIRSIRNFNNPGAFDYKRYMAFKSVRGTAYTKENEVVILKKNHHEGFRQIIENTRNGISGLIDAGVYENESRNVLKALITGEKTLLSRELRDDFNRAGVSHILAISGLHIGIVASFAFFLFNWVFSRINFFLWKGWTKKGAALLSLFPVILYGFLAGMSPSTQRAVIMVTVFLMTFWFERDRDIINTLSIAAIVILIISPSSLFSISFQLSFSAVFFIIYGISRTNVPGISDKNYFKKTLNRLEIFIKVSVFAMLGTLPFVMLYFNQVSLVGIPVNIIVVPLIGFVVVPLGLLSVFIYPFMETAAVLCIKIAGLILQKSLLIVHLFSDLPFAAAKTVTPSILEIICYYILLCAILNIKKRAGTKDDDQVQDKESGGVESDYSLKKASTRVATIIFCAMFLVFIVDIIYWMNQRIWHRDLRVSIIDVGQGTASLLELPGGYNILIDGGGFSDNSSFDVGERIIAPFLWRRKIMTVDTIILSHPNSDHLNGLLYIAKFFNVKNAWTNNETADTVGYRKFIEIIEKEDINAPAFPDIPETQLINGVKVNILYPERDFAGAKILQKSRNSNNNSLVIKVELGSKSFLFPGDIMEVGEKKLVAMSGEKLQSDVLIAPHHGSRTSSSKVFLDMVKAETVIIPAGWNNRYRFPSPVILKRYKERGWHVFRTDINGAVSITTYGKSLKVKPLIDSPFN